MLSVFQSSIEGRNQNRQAVGSKWKERGIGLVESKIGLVLTLNCVVLYAKPFAVNKQRYVFDYYKKTGTKSHGIKSTTSKLFFKIDWN